MVEHVLGIGQDSTKTCSEILKDIRRSKMDLNGQVVQQICGSDHLRSRSESPRGYWRESRRESQRSYLRDQSIGRPRRNMPQHICYFCGKDGCFSRDDHTKCSAFGEQCRKCRSQDHFQGMIACERGYSSRRGRRELSRPRSGRAV